MQELYGRHEGLGIGAGADAEADAGGRRQGQLLLAESGFDLLHIQGATLAASGSASGFGAELPDNERYQVGDSRQENEND